MINENKKLFTIFSRIIRQNNEYFAKELVALQKNPFMNEQDRNFSLLTLLTNIFIRWVDTLPRKARETQETLFKREAKIFSSGRKSLEDFIASKVLNQILFKEIF